MNLFMLTAPYQILNALEAIHHFQFSNNHLRIIDTGHFTRVQVESVIDPAVWKSVRYHNFQYKLTHLDFDQNWPDSLWDHVLELYLLLNQILQRQRANRIARKIGTIENLIMGNYRRHYDRHMRHLVNRLRFNRLFILDVGTDTLLVNRDRHADKNGSKTATEQDTVTTGLKYLKQWIKKKFLAWDTRGVKSLTFFTTYDINPAPGDYVIQNSYAFLKSVVASARPSNKVLFVGQPLVDQCYITSETFISAMSRIRAYFKDQNLVYICHPRESDKQLQIIRDLGITIQKFATPFEYAVSFSGERPYCIASFFSSAIENSKTIFGTTLKVMAFRLSEAMLLKDQASVSQVYTQLAANGQATIEVLDVFEM